MNGLNDRWMGDPIPPTSDGPCRLGTGAPGEYVVVGKGRWLLWHIPDYHDVRVEVAEAPGGRIVARSLFVEAQPDAADKDITPRNLRNLPLGRLGDFMTYDETANSIVTREMSLYRGIDFRPGRLDGREAVELAESLPLIEPSAPDLAIDRPSKEGRGMPDVFYERVAKAFVSASLFFEKPAVELAKANGVTPNAAHQWVREARKRGFLGPARRAIDESAD